ncbi:hypothetical protein V5P93_003768 [Actinokineospora auranticolor]|uniref:Uncharacterized protein n=1 Tax=Actinokineospora auranticolor TaxID=155976 RepID=A0A2S6GLG1_9PSEU|nr:hypothetical protein [Actinokineospora auranticolor]PPK66055.1 hypothetical protein CLV40_11119 [Actinokineospora auranticolor]
MAAARAAGLFPERRTESPYEERRCPSKARQADEGFWAEVAELVAQRGAVLVQESFGASRWFRVMSDADLEAVRARLAPRSLVAVWPDLADALSGPQPEGTHLRIVWQEGDRIHYMVVLDDEFPEVAARLGPVPSVVLDERERLVAAVLPDPDGCGLVTVGAVTPLVGVGQGR